MSSSVIDLNKLNCFKCEAFPVSPIFKCKRGHIICGNCKDELKVCPKCAESFSEDKTLNQLASQLKRYVLCKNGPKGCNRKILSSHMAVHLNTSCKYRDRSPPRCLMKGEDSCPGEIIPLDKVLDHLKTSHKIRTHSNQTTGLFNIETSFVSFKMSAQLPCKIIVVYAKKFDGHTFLRLRKVDTDVNALHSWICVIGDEAVAKQYKCFVSIPQRVIPEKNWLESFQDLFRKPECPPPVPGFSWNLQVVPIYECSFEEVLARRKSKKILCTISLADIEPLCKKHSHKRFGIPYEYSFIDNFEIQKC